MTEQPDHSLGDGVFYRPQDYVGFGPRLLILLIDVVVLTGVVWVIAFAWANTVGDESILVWLIIGLAVWTYLVVFKRSPLRTAGYQFARCRIVNLEGKPPSLFMMTFRLMFWILGPMNLLLDFIWCGIDQDRQTLRDRYSGVCVIRSDARRVGTGPIHLAYYDAMGFDLMLARVVHRLPESEESDSIDHPSPSTPAA